MTTDQTPALPPIRLRLADAEGVIWESDDAEYLRRWVADRNRSLPRP